MSRIGLSRRDVNRFIEPQQLDNIEHEVLQAKQTLLGGTGKGSDFLGWVDLPRNIKPEDLEQIQKEAHRLSKLGEVCVVVGIGGSYLGARAVIEAVRGEFGQHTNSSTTQIVYAGHTLDEDYYAELLELLDVKDYTVIVISKSGTTTEPAVAFRLLRKHLENKYGIDGALSRIVAITDQKRGALHDIAQQDCIPMYVIPDDVGGRFSVLTPVGLLPIAVAGIDIKELVKGACDMRELCIQSNSCTDNPALLYAGLRNILYRQGKKVELLVNYSPRLKYISEWWKQLFGESEGKEGKGILPHSLSFTTDLHSMGQYVQQGERLMFETVVSVDSPSRHVSVPTDNRNLDGINYLAGRPLTDINRCAEKGTTVAHSNGGVPIMTFSVPAVNEYWIGQLLYMFEFACGISGYMLGVNPFDQPGVESYKRNMFVLLGKPGYEGKELV